jgi:hypothetical protein
VIDASTAFRVADGWDYGFPELSKEQRAKLEKSKRISNPGCYPTGFIGLTRPLVDAGILKEGALLTVNAVSGYSGGGKGLMNIYENEKHEPWGAYGFSLVRAKYWSVLAFNDGWRNVLFSWLWSLTAKHFNCASSLGFYLPIHFHRAGTQASCRNGGILALGQEAHFPATSCYFCSRHGGFGPFAL